MNSNSAWPKPGLKSLPALHLRLVIHSQEILTVGALANDPRRRKEKAEGARGDPALYSSSRNDEASSLIQSYPKLQPHASQTYNSATIKSSDAIHEKQLRVKLLESIEVGCMLGVYFFNSKLLLCCSI